MLRGRRKQKQMGGGGEQGRNEDRGGWSPPPREGRTTFPDHTQQRAGGSQRGDRQGVRRRGAQGRGGRSGAGGSGGLEDRLGRAEAGGRRGRWTLGRRGAGRAGFPAPGQRASVSRERTRRQQERRGETRLPDPGGSAHRMRDRGLRALAGVWPGPGWGGGAEGKAASGAEKWAQERNHSSGAKVRRDHSVPRTGS